MSYSVGRGRPPKETQFPEGHSGNSKGRPKGTGKRKNRRYEAVFSQKVSVQIDGQTREVRADEAFMLSVAQHGAKGKPAAKRAAFAILEDLKPKGGGNGRRPIHVTYRVYADPGDVYDSLEKLGAARTLFMCQPIARVVIEPWAVQAALDRLGDQRLGEDEQKTVVAATRRPHKVEWPDWWSMLPQGSGNLEA
nr:hypothetical protein [uncultured organism]